ncbi:MAG: MmcQ/YjbR family DNA-binding protein [Burkholderiaceae bacterium]|nr:MmcQ/YjbR family DNA-binding protein [Burkholderiaceae bacterium]
MASKAKKLSFAKLREVCAAMPAATEDVKWGADLVYSIGGKMFAVTGLEVDSKFAFKVEDDRFLELTDIPGIAPSPYLARMKWVQIAPDCALSQEDAAALVRRSYELVFAKLTKKLQREISGG